MHDTIHAVSLDSNVLQIDWSDGHQSRFLGMWLRDNCSCDYCGTTISGQRKLSLRDFADTIVPAQFELTGRSTLDIGWPDGHQSQFDTAWLRSHCNCENCLGRRDWRLEPWTSTLDPELLVFDHDALMQCDETQFDAMSRLAEFGLIRVKNVPHDQLSALAEQFGYLHDTNYGKVLDMRVENESWFKVMSAGPIPAHTDNVYRYCPTGISLFHCVEQIAGGGGASYYIDGLSLAARIKDLNAQAYECLCTVPVVFYRHIPANAAMHVDAAFFRTEATMFKTDFRGRVVGLRYHPRTLAPMTQDEKTISQVYQARRLLEAVSEDPTLRVQFRADVDECTIYDNHRVMHARTDFEITTGARHFRQCHVDREEFHSRLRLLAVALKKSVPEELLTPGLV